MEYTFTAANFEEEVLQSELPVLVDFYADWCGPCKMLSPTVEAIAQEYDGKVLTIEADDLDFENRPEDFASITDRIDAELYGLFPLEK